MATNFPGSLDAYVNPVGSDGLASGAGGVSHASMHANLHDAVEAIEAKVGANGSGVTTSHDYKIAQLEAKSPTITVDGDASGSATLTNLGNGTLTLSLAVDSVAANEIADGAVGSAQLAADAVNGSKIADDSIDSEHYVDGSIDTAHIGDDQVTGAKIAHNTITATHIAADAVGSSELANNAVDTAAIADDAVTSAKIANNAVALGTQTTGNYVGTVSGGDGISVSGADAEGATKTVAVDSTVLRGRRGANSYYPDGNGYITITTDIPKSSSENIVAAFVQTTSQTTTGEGAPEYVLTLPVTAIYNNPSGANYKQFQCRVYEVNGSGNSDYTVSTIYDSSPPGINIALSWLVLT
jgi:hypothetical protein